MKTIKIIYVLFIAALICLLSGCSIQSPNCLNRECTRFQVNLNSNGHAPTCLTPDAQRYQYRTR
jgi:hypothetical protein